MILLHLTLAASYAWAAATWLPEGSGVASLCWFAAGSAATLAIIDLLDLLEK